MKLENEYIIVQAKQQGAELTSIRMKEDNTEYLWNADPSHWNRHAPILFPIVGRLVNNTYFVDGTAYEMSQHGFARDMTFDIIHQTDTSVSFLLTSTEETLKKYPFLFSLTVTYTLVDTKVVVDYKVENTGKKEMYFSIGAHPGFNCPIVED